MLNVVMLSVIMVNVVMLSAVMLNVIMLNVVAPFLWLHLAQLYETVIENAIPFIIDHYFS